MLVVAAAEVEMINLLHQGVLVVVEQAVTVELFKQLRVHIPLAAAEVVVEQTNQLHMCQLLMVDMVARVL
jgi:hypothetical protein